MGQGVYIPSEGAHGPCMMRKNTRASVFAFAAMSGAQRLRAPFFTPQLSGASLPRRLLFSRLACFQPCLLYFSINGCRPHDCSVLNVIRNLLPLSATATLSSPSKTAFSNSRASLLSAGRGLKNAGAVSLAGLQLPANIGQKRAVFAATHDGFNRSRGLSGHGRLLECSIRPCSFGFAAPPEFTRSVDPGSLSGSLSVASGSLAEGLGASCQCGRLRLSSVHSVSAERDSHGWPATA